MSVTIDQIKQLREMTGVSMMACKSALEEANGNFDEAITILRKKGEAKAAERSLRSTSQGVVAVKIEGSKAAMVQLACETDFVAKGEEFVKLADDLAEKLLKGEIKADQTDFQEVKDACIRTGENIKIEKMALLEGEVIGEYIHSNKKIGVLVALKGGNPELAKSISMHIAAANPMMLNPEDVPQELVNKEKEIWTEQLMKEGKPAEVVEKIMMGKEKKFREENSLLKQAFVKDANQNIEQLLATGGATVEKFIRFAF